MRTGLKMLIALLASIPGLFVMVGVGEYLSETGRGALFQIIGWPAGMLMLFAIAAFVQFRLSRWTSDWTTEWPVALAFNGPVLFPVIVGTAGELVAHHRLPDASVFGALIILAVQACGCALGLWIVVRRNRQASV